VVTVNCRQVAAVVVVVAGVVAARQEPSGRQAGPENPEIPGRQAVQCRQRRGAQAGGRR